MPHVRASAVPKNVRHSYYKFLAILDDTVDKEKLVLGMKAAGIAMNSLYAKLIYRHPVYQEMGFPAGLCPETEEMMKHQISLPIYSRMSEEEIGYVMDTLDKLLSSS